MVSQRRAEQAPPDRLTLAKSTKVHGEDHHRHEERPESEHVVRDAPELAIVDRATWDHAQKQLATRKRGQATRHGQVISLVTSIMTCSTCGGVYGVRGRKVIAGKLQLWFGCARHCEYGPTVCKQSACISGARAREALVTRLRELLDDPTAIAAFVRGFERRANARLSATKPADLDKQLAKAKQRASNATALLVEDPSDAEARQLRDEARAEIKRIEAQLANAAAPVTLPSTDAIASGLRRLLDLLADKPEVGRAALVRCGLRLRVTERRDGKHRFWLVGSIDLGAVAGGSGGGSLYGRNGCSSLPRTGFARRRATASRSSSVSRRT